MQHGAGESTFCPAEQGHASQTLPALLTEIPSLVHWELAARLDHQAAASTVGLYPCILMGTETTQYMTYAAGGVTSCIRIQPTCAAMVYIYDSDWQVHSASLQSGILHMEAYLLVLLGWQ